MASSSSVKVAVRVRPLNQREKCANSNIIVGMEGKQTTLETQRYSNVDNGQEKNKTKTKRFVYDYSYWSADVNDQHYTSQVQVFKDLGVLVLDAAFEGYNACVFAYGQTGAGKTYTMMGEKDDPGLVPRICEGLYSHVSSNNQESFRIEISYLEIYNEQVLDLLRSPNHDTKHNDPERLKVREHPKEGPYVQGLSKHNAPDYTAVESFLNQGNNLRKTAVTKMNDQSSRSHAIFTIKFTQAKFVAGLPSEITSKIHLVDLAGSERVSKSGATGERLKEGGNINKSLTTLGIVISTLAERSCQSDPTQRKLFIPYRDSILTWLLKDSLGGNSKTIMIAAISPSDSCYGETLSTLRYADRAKNIINAPTVNEDPNVKLIRELKTEIERLKSIIAGDGIQIRNSISDVDHAQKLLQGTESKMEKHLRNWTDKWKDTLDIIEESDLGLHKHRSTLRIDMDPPHLVLLDDDVLNTSITIFGLNEGDNLIGNINAPVEQDLVFDKENIKNEHCVVTYQNSNVMLTPRSGECHVNQKLVNESIKLSQGDIISLGQDIRLKFNFPQEASFLREKRKSGNFAAGLLRSLQFSSTPMKLDASLRDETLSPVTDESGVELDMCETSEDDESEKTMMTNLKEQVEDLLAKYKESEIARFEEETKNRVALEKKEKEIENQAMVLSELQKNNETLLQQHQKDLQTLIEQLSHEKQDIRSELTQQMEEVFVKFKFTNKELMDGSRGDFEKYKKSFNEQLRREWMKLDQYEIKLIEIEAEKRKTLDEAETRLKNEKTTSEEDRKRRFEDIENEKETLQDVLEGNLQELECSRNDYEQKEKDVEKCVEKSEKGINMFISDIRELEWLQYQLCREEGEITEEVSEVLQTVKVLTKDIQALESDNEKNKEKLLATEDELCERNGILKSCEDKVEKSKCEMVDLRKRFVDCEQRFGEELGDIVNSVNAERDAELRKIESDKEMLLSKHLEHQRSLEVLVNEGFEKIGEENEPALSEIKESVSHLVRSSSPGLERNSLQSQIVDKQVQIYHHQMDLGERERERRTLHNEEDKYLAIIEEVQNKREREQNELNGKIKALQLLTERQGNESEDTADYFESESLSLTMAQRDIVSIDKELAEKIRERRDIEEQIESAKLQMGLQAESSQEQFQGALEELKRRAKEKEQEIGEMRKVLQEKADQYLVRLRRESFVVLESPIKASNYMTIGDDAIDEILKEISMASHVPELAETYTSMMQDCGGWRYDKKEKDVDLLQKEVTNEAVHCFLGRGVIRASPHIIVKEVSNPASRFIYDRMLKNIRIIENFSDDLKIVYMLHETARCFVKYSRDFCYVVMNKEKDGKLVVASQSVEHTSCPEVKGVLRGKILSSGWVVQPMTIGGHACSLVWYLTRVYLGNSVPSKLVNLVSKRQPLCVAYLRDYLVPGR